MKHTLHFFFTFVFLLTGLQSFAAKKTKDDLVCPTASISYPNSFICTSSSIPQQVILTGTGAYLGGVFSSTPGLNINSVTGQISPSSSAPGTYVITYTIPSGPGCPSISVTTTATISNQPFAGTDSEYSICGNSTTPMNLYDMIAGEDTGGTWTRTSGLGGTFNSVGGIFTPTVGTTTSTFEYTVNGSTACGNDSCIVTINFNPIPTNITISGSTTLCAGGSAILTFTGTPNTVITWTDGGFPMNIILDGSGNAIIPVTPTVTTTYTLTSASLNGCTIPLNQSTTVIVNQTPQFINQIPDIIICNGETLNIASQLTTTVPGATIVWQATTSNINTSYMSSGNETNIDQIINLLNSTNSGTITIEVIPHIGSCNGAPQQILVTVKPIPIIMTTVANTNVICNNEFVTITTISNPSATAYNWQVINANGVQIVGGVTSGTSTTGIINAQLALTNPQVAGTISFEITPVNGICIGTPNISTTITVNPIPGSPVSLPTINICSGESTGLFISAYPNVAGTIFEWTVTDSQNVTGFNTTGTMAFPLIIDDVLTNTSNVEGFVKYSVNTKLGNCEGATIIYTVYVQPLPNPVLTDGHICVDPTTGLTYQGYVLDTQLSNPNFIYDWFLLNTTTSTYDQIAGASASTYETMVAGNYQVIVTNTITNCINEASADVIEVFPATGISTAISEGSTITVTVNPIGTGNLIYNLNNGAWQESNVFTGVEPGIHTVLVSDLEGCTNLSIEVDVNEDLVDLVMYTNTATDTLNFMNNNKVKTVRISNQIGQTVLTNDVNLKNGSIDISALNLGIYNIEFETEVGIVNHRIIKQ